MSISAGKAIIAGDMQTPRRRMIRREGRSALPRAFIVTLAIAGSLFALPAFAQVEKAGNVDRLCALIAEQADIHGLPEAFLARLLFSASAFDPAYVSPTGAAGVAKFNAAVAESGGLSDPSDIETAVPAAARRLSALTERLGNLGLAAAAYQAGEKPVRRWMDGDGYLPASTVFFVQQLTGKGPEAFRSPSATFDIKPLETRYAFAEACKRMPLIASGEASTDIPADMPWAVVVGAGPDLDGAMKSWAGVRERTGFRVGGGKVYVTHLEGGKARRNRYSVRIGAESRGSALAICSRLRGKGGACMVTRNTQPKQP
ncbi:MAG: lytic transglycosylase [Rhizobiales bacterium]|nr:lytic transglycosylase [Hyphomicrobiales bacterium]